MGVVARTSPLMPMRRLGSNPCHTCAAAVSISTAVFLLGWLLGQSSSGGASVHKLAVLLQRERGAGARHQHDMVCNMLPVNPIYMSEGPRLGTDGNKTYNPAGAGRHLAMHSAPNWPCTVLTLHVPA